MKTKQTAPTPAKKSIHRPTAADIELFDALAERGVEISVVAGGERLRFSGAAITEEEKSEVARIYTDVSYMGRDGALRRFVTGKRHPGPFELSPHGILQVAWGRGVRLGEANLRQFEFQLAAEGLI